MNMLINRSSLSRFGICCLAVFFLIVAALPLCAQAKRSRKPKISVPATVLECPYTAEAIFNKLNHLNEWVAAWQKASKEDFQKLWKGWAEDLLKQQKGQKTFRFGAMEPSVFVPRENSNDDKKKSRKNKDNKKKSAEKQVVIAENEQNDASGTRYKLTKEDLRKNYKPFEAFLRLRRLTDDMQEATKIDEAAFRAFDKKVKALEAVLEKMDQVRNSDGSLEQFRKLYEKEFIPALNAVSVAYGVLKETKKMPYEKRKLLQEKNEKRRREAYLQMMSEENAQQTQKQQEKR